MAPIRNRRPGFSRRAQYGLFLSYVIAVAGAVVGAVLLALATIHLASYPLHQWVWRAPAFALLESAVESVLSLVLIFAGRERWGTGRAVFGDWPAMAATTFLSRFAMVCLFALVLGGVAQFVRRREIRAERKRGPHARSAEPPAGGVEP